MSEQEQEPTKYDQHPGRECCESCLQDVEYDSIYSMWPRCCCRSEWNEDTPTKGE